MRLLCGSELVKAYISASSARNAAIEATVSVAPGSASRVAAERRVTVTGTLSGLLAKALGAPAKAAAVGTTSRGPVVPAVPLGDGVSATLVGKVS